MSKIDVSSLPSINSENLSLKRVLKSDGEFAKTLKQDNSTHALPNTFKNPNGLKFSQHAVDRMSSRGISMNPQVLQSLEMAVEKAAEKGSKNTLILNSDSAWIVNVNNKTVVTVMDKAMLKENVFTNIDSTIVI